MATTPPHDDINRDLGLGSRVAQQSRVRFLNRDGSFNVRRRGLPFLRSQNAYHSLLTISWTKFFLVVIAGYFLVNLLFATGYMLCGAGALGTPPETSGVGEFFQAFFFSVQTLATIGYGRMSPHGLAANLLVTFEALFGLLGFALATGLLFARFSRPSAQIVYSEKAVIAPYRGRTAFEFRLANERSSELIEVNVTVTLSRNETDAEGKPLRRFYPLELERKTVIFMPLHWVVVHPVDERSPLFGVTEESLRASDAEFLILLTATDETFSQTVHSRSSYKHDEIIWGASFADMFHSSNANHVSIDLRRIHNLNRLSP